VGHLLQDGALDQVEAGSHFDKALPFGSFFNERYAGMLGAVRELRDVVVGIGAHPSLPHLLWGLRDNVTGETRTQPKSSICAVVATSQRYDTLRSRDNLWWEQAVARRQDAGVQVSSLDSLT
jgi:hypothetical protein